MIYGIPLLGIIFSLLLILKGPAMLSAQAKLHRAFRKMLPSRSPLVQKA
jgi:lipopolysaccharide export system permease protein